MVVSSRQDIIDSFPFHSVIQVSTQDPSVWLCVPTAALCVGRTSVIQQDASVLELS